MVTKTALAAAALALGLALSGPTFAATEHAHGSSGAAALELTLNNGQKWPTDAALRQGMGEMRRMLAMSHGRLQADEFTPADYAALADRVQAQVDYVAANCKLPEEADRQLHVVLGAILEGVDAMRAGADRLQGARRVVRALEAYGGHFDDPDWPSAARSTPGSRPSCAASCGRGGGVSATCMIRSGAPSRAEKTLATGSAWRAGLGT